MSATSRIDRVFTQTPCALITYLMAGDPDLTTTLALMHAAANQGADVIELGLPFSDPMADGPSIQQAAERALANGVTTLDVLKLVAEFRQSNQHTAVISMGYANSIEQIGYAEFFAQAQQAGVDGCLCVDLPPEQHAAYGQHALAHHIAPITLLAPTTSPQRLAILKPYMSGFAYYVSMTGVTGTKLADNTTLHARIQNLKQQINCPLVVGFGIRDAATAKSLSTVADGIVIGSALVDLIHQHGADHQGAINALSDLVHSLKSAIHPEYS